MVRRSLLDGMAHRRSLRRWASAARGAPVAGLAALRCDRAEAGALRHRLDEFLEVAEGRLARPRGGDGLPRPPGTDWAWRPRLWRGALARPGLAGVESGTGLGEEARLFHDAGAADVVLRQLRAREGDAAPFGLRLEVFGFPGSYLGLAIDLPSEACEGLSRRHLVRLEARLEVERPLAAFARLNVRHGPNTEALLRGLSQGDGAGAVVVEFDLATTKLNERRVERMWLDLIFEKPAMNQVTVRDLMLARHPRAEL
jgi:hypothetical protein